ncbi:DUF3108 domain-containing protein [Massilia sp. PWRC2]|uniref:DUF3108 domain-containing protein n=1 Tax=Massilia sp. PWRC2 TaxID=2804626 RepID=UPI003CF33D22
MKSSPVIELSLPRRAAIALALCATLAAFGVPPAAAEAVKRAIDLPPSADLTYIIKARQKGFALSGDATANWRFSGGKYSFRSVTRAALFGTLIDNRSEGAVDSYGLAPTQFVEKRLRHEPWTTTFDRSKQQISFTESEVNYPLKGGEQDRNSVLFQLAAVARAAPEKFVMGAEWKFFVAGRRDADVWTFRVVKLDTVQTGVGTLDTVHLMRMAPPDAKEQALDIWLAPSKEWYPVRLRFTDNDDEYVEQTLQSITKK